MKLKKIVGLLCAACLLACLCAAKKPNPVGAVEALLRAQYAIDLAKELEAEEYAKVEFATAITAYNMARSAMLDNPSSDNALVIDYALEAEKKALEAAKKSVVAPKPAKKTEPAQTIVVTPPEPSEQPEYTDAEAETEKARYIAVARRRIVNTVFADTRRKYDKEKIEFEIWVSPKGNVMQVVLISGAPTSNMTRHVLNTVSTMQLDPFTPAMPQKPLKIRLIIDTSGKGEPGK